MRWWCTFVSVISVMACGGSDRAPRPGSGGESEGGPGGLGAAGVSVGGSSGGGGGVGSADVPIDATLGAPCVTDADCGLRTVCLSADSTAIEGGGPPHGMCVVDCLLGGGALCQSIDVSAICLTVGGFDTPFDASDDTAFCVPGCEVGDASHLATKCGGRLDVACASTDQPPRGYCFPACRNDVDCDGHSCDLGSGLCRDTPRGAGPIGAACETSTDCAGLCIGLSATHQACSGICTIGSGGCGEASFDGAPLDATCVFGEAGNLSDFGDLGFCAELCDCNDDCLHPDAVCESVNIQDQTGRRGVCYPADQGGGTVAPGLPCSNPDGGAPTEPDAGPDGAAAQATGGGADAAVTDAASLPVDGASADAPPG